MSASSDSHVGGDRDIRLVLADVDGTLLTSARTLAPSTIRMAQTLKERGIALAISSSRPPRGLLQFIEALHIETPTGAFNGGTFVRPDLTIVAETVLEADLAREVVSVMEEQGLDVWVYSSKGWYVRDLKNPHVTRESQTVRFEPEVLGSYEQVMSEVVKIVGVTDDTGAMGKADAAVKTRFGEAISASNSQTYYLDVTPRGANKGMVVDWLSADLDVPKADILSIGDGPNDILMFRRSGFSIAMANASPDVKAEADAVTSSNDEDGFARAIEAHVLSDTAVKGGS